MAYYMEKIADHKYIARLVWDSVPEGYYQLDWCSGVEIPEELVPARAIQKSSHKQLPHFFAVDTSPAVCEEFKELVEALEPGVHQFFPFEVIGKTGELLERPYYQMNILTRIDAIVPEHSNIYWHLTTTLGTYHLERGPGPVQLTLRKDLIAGHHLWHADKQYSRSNMFFSNELMQAVNAAKLKGLREHRLDEE